MVRRIVLIVALAAGMAGTRGAEPQTLRSNVTAKAESATPAKSERQTQKHSHTNRLAQEKSPYLLQHQYNPVDWYAWGPEAFEKARRENKPVFLSIGYSTCHWCHVMERESFENDEVAKFLNEHFVSIKVDREERPDVDKIYMTFVQATTGQGGWPLNTFLTPELKPFFGGTYFPPDNRYGRPSFLQLLQHIQKLWETRKGDLADSAAQVHAKLQEAAASMSPSNLVLTEEVIRNAGSRFKQSYDPRNGGFGSSPKFPQPSQPELLLRCARRFSDDEAKGMVLRTCEKMAAGGIHDQLGGGFARYSVDAEWLVPHFEKMLYDNAQLTQLYLDAYLVSGDKQFAAVARDILDYVLRDMTHTEGGFYSAEDADSEGHEGKFYCWTQQELSKLLSPEEFKVAVRYFGITEKGNFVDHSHPKPLPNQNVLSVVDPKLSHSEQEQLVSARKKMFDARSHRVRPHLDDKILASWNGLMLGAMARAGAVLDEEKYAKAAEKNVSFLRAKLWDPKAKVLYHRWREGERDKVELLEGYAFLLSGVIDLYESTLEPKHLEFAIELGESMIARFYDPEEGGFWQSPVSAKELILRVKDDYDGAEPSGNSVAVMALLKLGRITDRGEYTAAAEKTLRLFSQRLQTVPEAVPYMLQAFDFSVAEPTRAVLAGDPSQSEVRPLLRSLHSVYQPNKVVLGNRGPVEPFALTLPPNATNSAGIPKAGSAAQASKEPALVYICLGTACQAPLGDPEKLREALSHSATPRK